METAFSEAGIPYQREVSIDYSCFSSGAKKRARLDFVVELPTKRVIVEIDEHQHENAGYSVSDDIRDGCNCMQ